jgi:hypothetical protein
MEGIWVGWFGWEGVVVEFALALLAVVVDAAAAPCAAALVAGCEDGLLAVEALLVVLADGSAGGVRG